MRRVSLPGFTRETDAMANRRFEMYEYRQVLLRLRLGATDREVARVQRAGRAKVAHIRHLARSNGSVR